MTTRRTVGWLFVLLGVALLGGCGRGREGREDRPSATFVAEKLRESREQLELSADHDDYRALERAREAVVGASGVDSTAAEVRAQVARVRCAMRRFEDAIPVLQALARDDPANPETWGLLGEAHLAMGDYREAEEAFDALKEMDESFEALVRLARFAFEQEGHEAAIQYLDRALATALPSGVPPREVAAAQAQLSDVFFRHGYFEAALENAEKAAATNPDAVAPRVIMAQIARYEGRPEEARRILEEVSALSPNPRHLSLLAGAHFDLGRRAEGDSLLDAARRRYEILSGSHPELFNRARAEFLLEWNQDLETARAIAYQESRRSSDVYANDLMAWAYHMAGEHALAWSSIGLALRQGARDPRLFYHAAAIARAAGNREKFELYARRARELNPRAEEMYGAF